MLSRGSVSCVYSIEDSDHFSTDIERYKVILGQSPYINITFFTLRTLKYCHPSKEGYGVVQRG